MRPFAVTRYRDKVKEKLGLSPAEMLRELYEAAGREVPDYPYLRGDKIGPLWLRMLRDNVGESRLVGLERVPIPVDVHVARATFALGVVRGRSTGALAQPYEAVREAWFAGVKGLSRPTAARWWRWMSMSPSGTCPSSGAPSETRRLASVR